MKRYLVFAGHDYYPRGGWNDLHSQHDERDEAVRVADQLISAQGAVWHAVVEWCHIVDSFTGEPIYSLNDMAAAKRIEASKEDAQ